MQNAIERRFDAEMHEACESWKRECSYNATRFLQMLRNRGGAEAARRLLHKKGTSFGLERLAEWAYSSPSSTTCSSRSSRNCFQKTN
jgi:hypothetical protein